MPSRKYIDKKKCQYLGEGIWYDPDEDMLLAYNPKDNRYIEVDTDDPDNIR